MKILTNIRFYKLAGIAQTLSSLSSHIQKNGRKDKLELVGIEMAKSDNPKAPLKIKESRKSNFKVITATMPHPDIKSLANNVENVASVENSLNPIIKQYQNIIRREKPDVILLNGTYYLPWCLLLAARDKIKNIVLHYHGSLTKETEHYSEPMRKIFHQMEKFFDSDNLRYIFPSVLAKKIVAKEVFRRDPKNYCILPNAIPLHFFDAIKKKGGGKKRIGAVARWRTVKNPSFIEKFAIHNAHTLKGAAFNLLTDLRTVADAPSHIRRLVKLIQPMDNDKMAQFYSDMDLMICPSRFETYGNVAQESVASGTPALVSSNMGVAETFRRFGMGKWVVSFDSPAEVFKKIDQMFEEKVDPTVRLELKNELNPDRIHNLLLRYVSAK